MDPRLRNLVVGVISAGIAVWLGFALANGEYFLAAMLSAFCGWAVLAWTRGPLTEAWILAFLVFAYILGNRGFAQATPVGGLPLFFGELGLGVSLTVLLVRCAFLRELPMQQDWLNRLIVLWLALGVGRMVFDLRTHGIVALRDFATLYYAFFLFVAQAIASHPASKRLMVQSLTATFCLLPAMSLLTDAFPDFFFRVFTFRGIPLVLYKGDLQATFLFAGFFWLLPRESTGWFSGGWRNALGVLSLVLGLYYVSRAGMLGLLVALGLTLAARWYRPFATTAIVCVCGLLGATGYSLLNEKPLSETRVYAVYEHIQSLADFSGTRAYQNVDTADSGNNNRFRLIWWRTIIHETLANGPLLGLGFGHDLARGFVLAYDPLMEGDFTARSPHSILFTVFGRMGFVGLLVWAGFMIVFGRESFRLAVSARQDVQRRQVLALHGMCWVIVTSSCFGVVLEGPMGAIPFWVLVGLCHGQQPLSEPVETEDATIDLTRASLAFRT